jgi:hypothetical protein
MTRTTRVAITMSAVAIAAVGSITTGAVAAPATAHSHAHAHAHPHSAAATPRLHATIHKQKFTLKGARHFGASRVSVTLKSVGGEHELAIAHFKKGYSFKKLVADILYFGTHAKKDGSPTKKAIRHLDRAIAKSHLYGGIDAQAGKTVKETVVLPKGKYTVYDDSGDLPASPKSLTVTGATHHTKAPKTSGLVFMKKNQDRFGGSKVLPAKGTIKVVNHNISSPHFLAMIHVKDGTTRKQFLQALESNDPSIFLPGGTGTDILSSGQSQTLRYSIPKGTYGQACFFPDPVTGIPHAFMGMVRIVHVN